MSGKPQHTKKEYTVMPEDGEKPNASALLSLLFLNFCYMYIDALCQHKTISRQNGIFQLYASCTWLLIKLILFHMFLHVLISSGKHVRVMYTPLNPAFI